MFGTFRVTRTHLIFGVCLMLALALGYSLAMGVDSTSLAVVLLVMSVLSVPLFMRWHHPLLFLSWNACICPYFLPGQPYVWMLMVIISGFFALLVRSMNPSWRFIAAPSITWPLGFVTVVVLVTAFFTGGAGLSSMGSDVYGGKYYLYILLAVAGYFVFTSQPVVPENAGLYAAFFFLPGLTAIISNLIYVAGPGFYFLYELFPADYAMGQAQADYSLDPTAMRLGGLGAASLAAWCFMLARHGIRGMVDFRCPWRALIFLAAIGGCFYGGFRSSVIFFALVFGILFYLEGLWRTRALGIVILVLVMMGAGLTLFSERMPYAVQRALCFLPIEVNSIVRKDADDSIAWRVEMWKRVLPDVPQYLLKGKGYALNPSDLYLMEESAARGYVSTADIAALAGDYHNGPLSVVIPFGIWGVIGFGWFFVAGGRALYANHCFALPELQRINSLLLALFVARGVMFVCFVGSLYLDLAAFIGLTGFGVALNGGICRANQSSAISITDGEVSTT